MRSSLTEVYIHYVWATWDRLPLLDKSLQAGIYACLQAECRTLKAEVFAIGGIEDHVHVLLRFPATASLAGLVKQLKGSSSHLANHGLGMNGTFKWQGSYAAFSVESPFDGLQNYIRDQESHHHHGTLRLDWELSGDEARDEAGE